MSRKQREQEIKAIQNLVTIKNKDICDSKARDLLVPATVLDIKDLPDAATASISVFLTIFT